MNFNTDVLLESRETPVLVDFYASWCGPCRMIKPMLEQLSTERSDYKTVYVDIDKHPDLAKTYAIKSVPTLILFNIGKPIGKIVGGISKSQLSKFLDRELPVQWTEITTKSLE